MRFVSRMRVIVTDVQFLVPVMVLGAGIVLLIVLH
jgi:hypothetical protein